MHLVRCSRYGGKHLVPHPGSCHLAAQRGAESLLVVTMGGHPRLQGFFPAQFRGQGIDAFLEHGIIQGGAIRFRSLL